jgi:NADH dehydrogenase
MFIHLMKLVGFRNRVVVFINWMWSYINYDSAIRLIIRPFVRRNKN